MYRRLTGLILIIIATCPAMGNTPRYATGKPTQQTYKDDPKHCGGVPFVWEVSGVLDCYDWQAEKEATMREAGAAAMLLHNIPGGVTRPDIPVSAALEIPPLTAEMVTAKDKQAFRQGETISDCTAEVTLYVSIGLQAGSMRPDPEYTRKFFPSTPDTQKYTHRLEHHTQRAQKVSVEFPKLSEPDIAAFDRLHHENRVVGFVGYISAGVEYRYTVQPGGRAGRLKARTQLLNFCRPKEIVDATVDDYLEWFSDFCVERDDADKVSSSYWPTIMGLAAACRGDEIQAATLIEEARELQKQGFEDDPGGYRELQFRKCLAQVKETRARLVKTKQFQDELLAQVVGVWQELCKQVDERLLTNTEHEDELTNLQTNLRLAADTWELELKTLAFQDEAARKRWVEKMRKLATQPESPQEMLKGIRGLVLMREHILAFAPLVRYQADHPDDPIAIDLRQRVDLYFLHEIYSKLRRDCREVDDIVRQWGSGQVNPEDGSWQLPNSFDIPWTRWMGLITARTYDLWADAQSGKAGAVEQMLGLHLIVMLRSQNAALTLEDVWRLTPEEILQRLPGSEGKRITDPGELEYGRQLEAAVHRAMCFNPDLEMLRQGRTPPVHTRPNYIDTRRLYDEFAIVDAMASKLAWDHIVLPAVLGVVARPVIQAVPFHEAVELMSKHWAGKVALAPARAMARFDEMFKQHPWVQQIGNIGISEYPEFGLVANAATTITKVSEYMGASGYQSTAISLFAMLYTGAGQAYTDQLRAAVRRPYLEKLANMAEERLKSIRESSYRNGQEFDKLTRLTELAKTPGSPDAENLALQARTRIKELTIRINDHAEGLPLARTDPALEEMVMLREAYKALARPLTSRAPQALKIREAQFTKNLEAAKKMRARTVVEREGAVKQDHATREWRRPLTAEEQATRTAAKAERKRAVTKEQAKAKDLWAGRRTSLSRGMLLEHHQNIRKFAQGEQLIVIVRNSNANALKFHNTPGYQPKPCELNMLKTAKEGVGLGLVTCRLQDFGGNKTALVRAQAEILKKGFQIDAKGIVRNQKGEAFYSDYDLHGVYKADGSRLADDIGTNTPKFLRWINKAIWEGTASRRCVQHGGHDDWSNPAKCPMPPATAYLPNGHYRNLDTVADMKAFYAEKGIEWPYPGY